MHRALLVRGFENVIHAACLSVVASAEDFIQKQLCLIVHPFNKSPSPTIPPHHACPVTNHILIFLPWYLTRLVPWSRDPVLPPCLFPPTLLYEKHLVITNTVAACEAYVLARTLGLRDTPKLKDLLGSSWGHRQEYPRPKITRKCRG